MRIATFTLVLALLGCHDETCEDHDCARIELPLAAMRIAEGGTAIAEVSWMRAHGGGFCPETPSVTSTDETIVVAAFEGACTPMHLDTTLRITTQRRGSARLDVANGGGREGWRDIDVVPLGHIAVLPATASQTDRQDPPDWEIHVGTQLDLETLAYDADGGPLRADEAPAWESLDPSVLTLDDTGAARGVAAGETDVQATLLGRTATLHIVVQP